MEEVLTMRQHEVERLQTIRKVIEGGLTWKQAGEQLGISDRQVGRLCAALRQKGARGIIHGLRGKSSNHQPDLDRLSIAMSAVHDPMWEGFKPGFACEKLKEHWGIHIGRETLRKAMIATGAWLVRHQRPTHRSWRERSACVGMMEQMDGSHHDWFEGRGPRCVLLLMIDDATSSLQQGLFADSEDTLNVMRLVKGYVERHGRPGSLYVDKDSIYRTSRQPCVEEQLKDKRPATQFERAMDELGVRLIWAHSPQAKGRVERSFKTHQDRLIKELRLARISDLASANKYLQEVYIPRHNARYAVQPRDPRDAHRPLLRGQDLDRILSIRIKRTLRNDYTVQFERRFLQILASQPLRQRPGNAVWVETRLDGSMHLLAKGKYLPFKSLESRPYSPHYELRPSALPKAVKRTPKGKHKPGRQRWLWYGWRGKKSEPTNASNDELSLLETPFFENLEKRTLTATP